MSNITYVSFLIWTENNPITMEKRLEWLNSILELDIELLLFVDPIYLAKLPAVSKRTTLIPILLEDLETVKQIRSNFELHPPPNRNHSKDTIDFLTLMNCKPELLRLAKPYIKTPYVAYIDAGIKKVFKNDSTLKGLETLRVHSIPLILLPGCNQIHSEKLEDLWFRINWMFSGGFFIVPVERIDEFLEIHLKALNEFLSRKYITWEVNVWALFGEEYKNRIVWYHGPHDDTMITGIPASCKGSI